jgi:hypothetical protein
VVDFSGKNPNVLYETGIAHTLGKTVIPLTQSVSDIPFDLKPHRALLYSKTEDGLKGLVEQLSLRLKTVMGNPAVAATNP